MKRIQSMLWLLLMVACADTEPMEPGDPVCGPGTYGADCAPCPEGSFSDGTEACEPWTVCEAGEQIAAAGSATSDQSCAACAEDTFSDGTNATECAPHVPCAAGSVQTGAGTATASPECTPCDEGTYCAGDEAEAIACAADTWDHDADPATACIDMTSCLAGQFVEDAGTPTTDRTCSTCEDGTFTTAEDASECTAWTVCLPGEVVATTGDATTDRVCTPCDAGSFCAGGEAEAVACAVDTWDHDADPATACVVMTACTPGQFVEDPGTPAADRTCSTCEGGTFTAAENASQCTEWTACTVEQFVEVVGTSSQDQVCAPLLVGGDSCEGNDQCRSGACADGVCLAEPGSACSATNDCSAGICFDDVCTLEPGDACGDDASLCLSGRCDAGVCDTSDWGESCIVDEHCDASTDGECGVDLGVCQPNDTFFVDAAAPSGGDGTLWERAFRTVEEALAAAEAAGGGEIWVAEGTYSPPDAGWTPSSNVSLYGGFAGGETRLADRDPSGLAATFQANPMLPTPRRLMDIDGATGLVIDGFVLRGGDAGTGNGGGLLVTGDAEVTLENLVITENTARRGGGMHAAEATITMRRVAFASNTAGHSAGAYVASGTYTLDASSFEDNAALGAGCRGGGLFISSATVTIDRSRFVGNTVTETSPDFGAGGAFYVSGSASDVFIANSLFVDNEAMHAAGGSGLAPVVYQTSSAGPLTIRYSTFLDNRGTSNAGMILARDNNDVDSSIIWGCGSISCAPNLAGSHNLIEDQGDPTPLFEDRDGRDLRPAASSPAIDAGNPDTCAIDGFSEDLAGTERPVGAACDVGALEAVP